MNLPPLPAETDEEVYGDLVTLIPPWHVNSSCLCACILCLKFSLRQLLAGSRVSHCSALSTFFFLCVGFVAAIKIQLPAVVFHHC